MLILRVDGKVYIVEAETSGFILKEQKRVGTSGTMSTVNLGSYTTLKTLVNRLLNLQIIETKKADSLFMLIDQSFRTLERSVADALIQISKLDNAVKV